MGDSSEEDSSKSVKTFTGLKPEEYEPWQKRIGRWCRKRHGAKLGDMYWEGTLPVLDTTFAESMNNNEFKDHVLLVFKSINGRDFRRAKHLWGEPEFWTRAWHVDTRESEYDRIYDYVSGKTTEDAALEVESLGRESAPMLKAHLQKHFGGAGSDVRNREFIYESGMPEKSGKAVFYNGINMDKKLRELAAEKRNLSSMCPEAKRGEYEFAKESTLVKIVLKYLRGTEFHETAKKLLSEIKVLKKAQAMIPVYDNHGDLQLPDSSANTDLRDDWDFRNYDTRWLPTWDSLRSALVADWKEASFEGGRPGEKKGSQIPTMMHPGFGQRNGEANNQFKCYGCGEPGHRIGASECTAGRNVIHHSAPEHVKKANKKRHANSRGGKGGGSGGKGNRFQGKKPSNVCNYFAKTGTCRFGTNCKYLHESSGAKGGGDHGGKRQKLNNQKEIVALAVKAIGKKLAQAKKAKGSRKGDDGSEGSDDDSWLAALMMMSVVRRKSITVDVRSILLSPLLKMTDVGMDSCSGTSISTRKYDFLWLDESTEAKESVSVRGPSVGTPSCGGIGPVAYHFMSNGKPAMLVDPEGVFADIDKSKCPEFRILSTQKVKKFGLKVDGGVFEEDGKAVCVRTGLEVSLHTEGDILVMQTKPPDRTLCEETPLLRQIVEEIRQGTRSPFVTLDDLETAKGNEHNVNRFTGMVNINSVLHTLLACSFSTSVMVMNEGKLSIEQRSRLWCRRFGYCDTALFAKMKTMSEYGNFPNVKPLNEDNKVSTQAKFKRSAYPSHDPQTRMDHPPWWRVYCDGYGGQQSLGGESYEGAVGGYLFVCPSSGAEDLRLYASHVQFPIALHQFLTRVEAEYRRVHIMYMDTFSVNLSEETYEVAALFQLVIMPVSAGTPQEMAFVESRVRLLKRHSTAQLLAAPHLPKSCWALSDKYAIYCRQFLPQVSRDFHCSFYLRTGKVVDFRILFVKNFGAPLDFSPIDGPIHKRAAITVEGFFVGIQWPAALVMRKRDMKVLSVSTKKIKVYESAYLNELDSMVDKGTITDSLKMKVIDSFPIDSDQSSSCVDDNNEPQEGPGFAASMGQRDLPPATKSMVQSIVSQREHQFHLPGKRQEANKVTQLDNSAIFGAHVMGEEGLYVSECVQTNIEQVQQNIETLKSQAAASISRPSVRQQIMNKLSQVSDLMNGAAVQKGSLKVGKSKTGVSSGNILDYKRKHATTDEVKDDNDVIPEKKAKLSNKKVTSKIRKDDHVSCAATLFDGVEKGSYSDDNPDRCFGIVQRVKKNGVVLVKWDIGGETWPVNKRDLRLEKKKLTSATIIVLLIEGEQVAFENKDVKEIPKNFFQLLVKSEWRKWVQAVKAELEGWDANNAVTIVDIEDVPARAKIVPLGELYSIKRDGRYKYRQYLMGNLLREGVDYQDTFSTTISGSGICIFYSMATTCNKPVCGWDAVCGYLQAKEQNDLYAFFPSHQQYSNLSYEELATFRKALLKLLQDEGEGGLVRLASKHRKESRGTPRQVLKLNSAIYGAPSAGHEFEMLIHSVHTKTCGLLQTQPEPSMFVKILVDKDDKVTSYLVVAAFSDDIRFFGTDDLIEQYKKDVMSKIKVKFEEPPTLEFVSIETHQDMNRNLTELKMPKYWSKAAIAFGSVFKSGLRMRKVPLSVLDEKVLLTKATDTEMLEAKGLPYAEMTGVMSYPAGNCKFEMRYVISLLGSHRAGFSVRHFDICKKAFEYGFTTREMGLIYSDGLDPHGRNVLWATADSGHAVPRSQGCRIVLMNGAAVSFRSKKHSLSASSTCVDEIIEMYEASTDVLGLRNLMAEMGMFQQEPTTIYQDNKSAIQIANNRGSLGVTSRAIDLKTLNVRNRIEDHQIQTEYCPTPNMIADMGTKALPEAPFCTHRDAMNGYALVKASFPDYALPSYVSSMSIEKVNLMISLIPIISHENL